MAHYSTIVFTYGASLSNPLSSVPGSSSSSQPLSGVYPALALVGWYNGHPAFSHLKPDLSSIKRVSVIGHGNVALDVSRILLKRVQDLDSTDIPDEVLSVLAESKVESVVATGRRGPGQVAFTTKEFREMLNLPGVRYEGLSGELVDEAKGMAVGDRMKTRLLGLMEKSSENGDKQFKLDFLKSPKAFKEDKKGQVGSVEWTVNQLLTSLPGTPAPPISQAGSIPRASIIARPTDETVVTSADMVVESVGYRSEPLGVGESWSLPFDSSRGRVQNQGGRIVDGAGVAVCQFAGLCRGLLMIRYLGCMPLGGQQEDRSESLLVRCTTPTHCPISSCKIISLNRLQPNLSKVEYRILYKRESQKAKWFSSQNGTKSIRRNVSEPRIEDRARKERSLHVWRTCCQSCHNSSYVLRSCHCICIIQGEVGNVATVLWSVTC